MTQRAYSGLIANNDQVRIAAYGQFVYCRSTTGQLLVTADSLRNNQGGKLLAARVPLTARQVIRVNPEAFDNVIIRNESGGQVDFEVIVGVGDYSAPLAEVSLSGPNTIADFADVAAGAAATSILAADADRQRAHIKAPTGNNVNIRVGGATITATRGVQLQPGEGITIEGTMEIFAIRESAGISDVALTVERLL